VFDAIPNGFKHAANLPIDSLTQHNAQTRGRDGVKSHDFGSPAVQKNSASQFRRERRVPRPIQRYLVFFFDFMTRMGKPLRQVAIICEEKQTFSLRIQPAYVEELEKFLGKQIKDRVARVLIFSSRNKSGGFVQHNRHCGNDVNKFAIDFNVVARARLCAEVGADLTVDGHTTRRYQLIAISP
jgi:hypothetical protein